MRGFFYPFISFAPAGLCSALYRFATSMGMDSDSELRLALFRQILAGHDDMISRICLGYAHTNEDFEDLRQDAYANIWRGTESFRGDSKLTTWIYRVTLNTCVSSVRRRYKDGCRMELSELAEIVDDDSDRLGMIAGLHEAISLLPDMDKAVVLMWLDGMNYEEISEVTGLKRGTLATRLHRAKEKLKKAMI